MWRNLEQQSYSARTPRVCRKLQGKIAQVLNVWGGPAGYASASDNPTTQLGRRFGLNVCNQAPAVASREFLL